MIFHSMHALPKIKTAPVYKKPYSGSNTHEVCIYYDKKYAFICDESNSKVIANFQNIAAIIFNYDQNERELLFNLACKPDWNDNKDVNYAMVTSESTIQKIREICNDLYKLSTNHTTRKPTILAYKQVVAYTMMYPKFLYYKLVKNKQDLKWKKDGEIKLYNRSGARKAKYEQFQEYVNNRYYVIGDQTVYSDGIGEDKYYIVYDEFRVYDLYKRKIIETTSTRGAMVEHYEDHEAFSNIGVFYNGFFVIRDKVIVRPVVTVDIDGVIAQIKVDVHDGHGDEETIEIGLNYDGSKYEPIILFFSYNDSIVVTNQQIFVYDLTQSSYEPLEEHGLTYPPDGGINVDRMKLYKYKNFFILFDGSYLISVYYDKEDSKYYFNYNIRPDAKLHEFNVIGHILSPYDDDDCIGMVMASQKHELVMTVYDAVKKEVYFSDIIKYNYLRARKNEIASLLRAMAKGIVSKNFVLQILSNDRLFSNMMGGIQQNEKHLNVVIGKDTKIVMDIKRSYLSLNRGEIYRLNFVNYTFIYEQPCLVRFVRNS